MLLVEQRKRTPLRELRGNKEENKMENHMMHEVQSWNEKAPTHIIWILIRCASQACSVFLLTFYLL